MCQVGQRLKGRNNRSRDTPCGCLLYHGEHVSIKPMAVRRPHGASLLLLLTTEFHIAPTMAVPERHRVAPCFYRRKHQTRCLVRHFHLPKSHPGTLRLPDACTRLRSPMPSRHTSMPVVQGNVKTSVRNPGSRDTPCGCLMAFGAIGNGHCSIVEVYETPARGVSTAFVQPTFAISLRF